VARTRLTDEFVRHFTHLQELTGNNPSGVIRALDKHPKLAVSIARLHEIQKRVETHRKFSERRFLVQTHPNFPKAFKDFQERWPRAYAETQGWQDAKNFVRHYRFLIEQTGNDPNAIQLAFDPDAGREDRNLYSAIDSLIKIQRSLGKEHIPAIIHLLPEYPHFREALADFTERWVGAIQSLRVPVPIFDLDDDSLPIVGYTSHEPFSKSRDKSNSSEGPSRDGDWHFDPDRDSAGEVISWVEGLCRHMAGSSDDDYDGWAADGLEWLQNTVGLDFDAIQARFREFPVIAVPPHVADNYDPTESQKLFRYLTQIRLSYIIGADLAAIALCRATTELLMQDYYSSDQDIKYDLPGLIRLVQNQQKFSFLRKHNLIPKVRDANNILHGSSSVESAADRLRHQNRARGLAREWVKALEEMIIKAPLRGSAGAKAP
jgi:hypothetical protein